MLKIRRSCPKKIDLELNNFVKKFDHRSSEKIADKEASAWYRLFERINGR